MKVKEPIEELQKMNQDAEVYAKRKTTSAQKQKVIDVKGYSFGPKVEIVTD